MVPLLPEESELARFILDQVLVNVRCAACGAAYSPKDVSVVEHRGDVWLLVALCSECQAQALVMVVVQDKRSVVVDAPPLTKEDVLNFHRLISAFDGDLRELFGSDER